LWKGRRHAGIVADAAMGRQKVNEDGDFMPGEIRPDTHAVT
jgi:hypothetical protein